MLRIAARDTLPRRAWLGTSYHTAAIVLRAARLSMAISRRSSIISALRPPCIVRACRIRHHGLTFVPVQQIKNVVRIDSQNRSPFGSSSAAAAAPRPLIG